MRSLRAVDKPGTMQSHDGWDMQMEYATASGFLCGSSSARGANALHNRCPILCEMGLSPRGLVRRWDTAGSDQSGIRRALASEQLAAARRCLSHDFAFPAGVESESDSKSPPMLRLVSRTALVGKGVSHKGHFYRDRRDLESK